MLSQPGNNNVLFPAFSKQDSTTRYEKITTLPDKKDTMLNTGSYPKRIDGEMVL